MTAAAIFLGVLFVATFAYLTLVWVELKWAAELIKWEATRDLLWFDVYNEARVTTAIPPHTNIVEGPGGNLMIKDAEPVGTTTLLNYGTLKAMVKILQEQEADRRVYTEKLKVALDKAASYEMINPQPQPPTIFGRRIPIP